ncbi:MAG: alpha-L-fucosidase [Planctomycetota bacterium]|jgi:alpha-L-fucosidase
MKRRDFIKITSVSPVLMLLPGLSCKESVTKLKMPSFLAGYEKIYQNDPRQACIQWFRDTKFGLFIHYGLYSLLGRHEWVQYREKIPVAEYAKLKDRFTAEKFDADFITDLALEAEMKYINIVTRHHDSFCLFKTKQTDFNTLNCPAKRDLVGELANACRKKGIGLFFYYSHGRDWKHPHAPNNDQYPRAARPQYDPPETSYAYGKDHNLQIYVDFMTAQIKELLNNYGPIAGIWLDGIATPVSGDVSKFQSQKLYDIIHTAQPQVLVSYKQGLLGTEDFFAPERNVKKERAGVDEAFVKSGKPFEICDTLQPKGWGYIEADNGKHKTADHVMQMLENAARQNANLLLNTGPLPDGSIHPQDIKTLREVGKRLRSKKA